MTLDRIGFALMFIVLQLGILGWQVFAIRRDVEDIKERLLEQEDDE